MFLNEGVVTALSRSKPKGRTAVMTRLGLIGATAIALALAAPAMAANGHHAKGPVRSAAFTLS